MPIKKNSRNFKFQVSLNSTVQSNILSQQSVININILFLSESRGTETVFVHMWSNLYFENSFNFLIVLFYTFYILPSLYLFYLFIEVNVIGSTSSLYPNQIVDGPFKLQKRCARLILDIPRDAESFDSFQKLKWLPIDQIFKLNKLGLLKKVINERVPEYLITILDSLRFEHKYSTRTKTLYRLPKPRTEAMRRTFFYSTIKELNALNLEPTTSFSLMKTTLTNNVASNYTVDNFKVKKLFWFLKNPCFLF